MTNTNSDDGSAGDTTSAGNSAGEDSATTPSDAEPSTAHVFMEDAEEDIEWPAGKRLLYAMLDAGLDAPYGCTEGECGACQCVVEPHDHATTHMVHNNVLDEYDIADDMTLACQTVSDTPGGKFDVSYDF